MEPIATFFANSMLGLGQGVVDMVMCIIKTYHDLPPMPASMQQAYDEKAAQLTTKE